MRRFNDQAGLGPLPEAERQRCYAMGVADERARCANKLRHSNASLLLMTGEMTAQELRTVHAVLNGIRSQIERA